MITSKLCVSGLLAFSCSLTANAAWITGSADPDYTTQFQGASAATFAALGFSIGTGANDLKVNTSTFVDPAGLIFGTVVPGLAHGTASGTTYGKLNYAYGGYHGGTFTVVDASANARDYDWLQNYGTNPGNDPTLDTPWNGTVWDLGGQANQAVVFPVIDHGPLPAEAVEYTVYLTNNPNSTNLSDWYLATLDAVYLQGWEPDNISIADGFTTVWKLPNNQTFRYVSVEGVGSQAFKPINDTEDEIDAVAGLTAKGTGVGTVPIPSAGILLISGLLFLVRRKSS